MRHRKPHQPFGRRSLRLERCEDRRVLSVSSLDLGGWNPADQTGGDYLLAASSGLVSIDADTDLSVITNQTLTSRTFNGVVAEDGGSAGYTFDSDQLSRPTLFYDLSVSDLAITNDQSFELPDRFSGGFSSFGQDDNTDGVGDADGERFVVDPTIVAPSVDFTVPTTPTLPDTIPVTPATPIESPDETVLSGSGLGDGAGDAEAEIARPDDANNDPLPERRTPVLAYAPIQRVTRVTPPAGADQPGAGLIDLTELLVSAKGADRPDVFVESAPVATSQQAARDAALAVESWVRSTPVSATTEVEAIPADKPLQAEGDRPPAGDGPTDTPRAVPRPTTAQAGQPMQPDRPSQPEPADVARAGEPVVAPGVIERSNAYRLAMAAFTTLLGGGLVWGTSRGKAAAEPACDERPRRRPR